MLVLVMEALDLKQNPKLLIFVSLLKEWQTKLNLISDNTLNDIWERHIVDSIQILNLLTKDQCRIIDLGTGSGFPAIILAILTKNQHKYSLVECNTKKCAFLNHVKAKLELDNISIYNSRIESLIENKLEHFNNYDYLLSRGLTKLEVLLKYATHFLNKGGEAILPKGVTWRTELKNVSLCIKNQFSITKITSVTNIESKIIVAKYLGQIL